MPLLSSYLFPVTPSGASGFLDKGPHIGLVSLDLGVCVRRVQAGSLEGGRLALGIADLALNVSLLLALGVFLVILLSISSFFLYASPETWIGLGFIASRNYIGSDAADYYNVYDLDGQ